MKDLSKKIVSWVIAAVVLTVGILCIVAGASAQAAANATLGSGTDAAQAAHDAYVSISMVLGITFIVVASIALIASLVLSILSKKSFAAASLGYASVLSVGIFFVASNNVAGDLIVIFLNYIPFLLVVAGSIIAIDAILTLVFAILNKNIKSALVAVIVEAVIAIVAIVLGSLCLSNVINTNARLIIFGIIVILAALYIVLASFVNTKKIVAVITVKNDAKEDKVVDANVEEVKETEETKEEATEAQAE